ncbi:hypothetical protein MKX72_20330 [Priestia sp. FSL R5-0597]
MTIYWLDGKPHISTGNGYREVLPTELAELDAANEITGSVNVDHD